MAALVASVRLAEVLREASFLTILDSSPERFLIYEAAAAARAADQRRHGPAIPADPFGDDLG